jgi:hypothetical protein
MQNYLKIQEHPKKLTKYLVFKHLKMAFYFWIKPIVACKTLNQGGMVLLGTRKTGHIGFAISIETPPVD